MRSLQGDLIVALQVSGQDCGPVERARHTIEADPGIPAGSSHGPLRTLRTALAAR